MKKILLVSYYFNLRDTDRAYTAYCYLKKRGYEVKVLCGNYDHNSKTLMVYRMYRKFRFMVTIEIYLFDASTLI